MSQTLPEGWSISISKDGALRITHADGMKAEFYTALCSAEGLSCMHALREAMRPPAINWKAYGISVQYCEDADCGPALWISCIVDGARVSIEVPVGPADDALRAAEHIASGRPQARVYTPSALGGALAISGVGSARVMTPERVRLAGVFCQIVNDWMQK